MGQPLLIAAMFGLAVFLIVVGRRPPAGSLLTDEGAESMRDQLTLRLRRAGMMHVSGSGVLVVLAVVAAVVGIAVFFLIGSLLAAFVVVALVPGVFLVSLNRKARRFHEKLMARLVPFLRQIQSQVTSGIPVSTAFLKSAKGDPMFAWALREEITQLELQGDFSEVIESSLRKIPLRPWLQFVRAVQKYNQKGGDLPEVLAKNVERINSGILRRTRLMGDVNQHRGQQKVLIGVAVAAPLLLTIVSKELYGDLFTTLGGWITLGLAAAFDGLALFITHRAIKDVEEEMEA